MGFPVPLTQWLSDDLSVFFKDINNSLLEENRNYIDQQTLRSRAAEFEQYSRANWALISLELWHRQFHDRADYWRGLVDG